MKNKTNINKKVSSRIESYVPNKDYPNVNLTLEEVEKEFPKLLSDQELLDNEYTIVRQETNGKLNELIKYKFQYDLLVWQVFFEKCHDVEKVFFIKDDLLDKAEKSNSDVEDITVREIKYRRQNKEYSDKLVEEYYNKKYDEYVSSMKTDDRVIEEKTTKRRYGLLVMFILFMLLAAGNYFIPYNLFCPFKYTCYIMTGLFGLLGLLFFILFLATKKTIINKKYESITRPHMSYNDWLDKQKSSEEIQTKISLMKKNYILTLKEQEDKIVSYSLVLKNIKERMMELIPLYKDFYTEEQVNYLLNTVIDRKCDTIRKAVKLAKTKDYHMDYLSSTERLAKSFKFVENYAIYIKEYNNLASDKRIIFDRSIEVNNIILEYLNRINLDNITINNNEFIK